MLAPNPFDQFLEIRTEDIQEEAQIRLISITGQELRLERTQLKGSVKMDLSEIASGAYLLEIRVKDKIITKRIVKK
ncbi:MAG: T9SS type A sorting domain-containing protein [Bacteroidia bacterium]|nr:T9SS type A sorting domain-containing protein [Bacteroidia bacterium]